MRITMVFCYVLLIRFSAFQILIFCISEERKNFCRIATFNIRSLVVNLSGVVIPLIKLLSFFFFVL